MSDSRGGGRMNWGIIVLALGVLFLLHNLDVIDFGHVIRDFWPLILVAIGLRMILFPGKSVDEPAAPSRVDAGSPSPGAASSSSQQITESKFIGDTNVKMTSEDFRGGSISCFIGDENVDLSEVTIQSGERAVYISGFIGDVKVSAPKKMPFMITANTTVGSIRFYENKYEGFAQSRTYKSEGYDTASTRLRVQVSKFIGDVTLW